MCRGADQLSWCRKAVCTILLANRLERRDDGGNGTALCRELREEDAPRVHALASCPEVAQYMRIFCTGDDGGTRALIREYRSGRRTRFSRGGKGHRPQSLPCLPSRQRMSRMPIPCHISVRLTCGERVTVRNCSSEWCGMPVMFWGRKG